MFYRGADIPSLNQTELTDGVVRGDGVTVIDVDFPEGESASDYKYQDVSSFERYITDRREVPVTGGMTDNLPAAIKFTKERWPPGLVLFLDGPTVGAQVKPIEYDTGWFNDRPGVLAHVTTLRDGELREDGRITALLRVDETKTTVDEWRDSEVQNEATASRYTTESEAVAEAESVDISGAVQNMVMYRGTTGTSPYTLATALFESETYQSSLGDIRRIEDRTRVAGSEEYRKQAELLYDEVGSMIQGNTNRLYLVAVDRMNEVSARNRRIQPDNFRFVYNGRVFDTSYERNSHLLGGR